MAQHAKPIDITRSFVLTDPNAFPNNQGFTQGEDNPEKLPLILGFEGYNFIPTSYGYKSFFGANSILNIDALTSRCDRMFLFQLMNYQNLLVALCEDGIWVSFPSHPGNPWNHWVTQPVPAAGTYKEWTHCVIENNLYCYREGDVLVHKISPTGTAYNSAPVPSTITFGAPYANSEANVVAGTYDISVAQIVAGVPSSITADAGTITLATGQAFDVTLAGYVGDAILYFTHQTTGVIYKQTVVGLTVAPQNFLALTVASTDLKAQGLPDPDAFNYITNFTPCCFKTYATTAARTSDTTLTAANVEKVAYDQQTGLYYILTNTTPTWRAAVITATNPPNVDFRYTLNMAGQKGLFRANSRLGFWDSANSISWGDLFDITDFIPSVETRAGYAIFSGVKGRIVSILAQGDGFVIYTTKGIVGVRFVNDLSMIWEATPISDTAGIAYDREVTVGVTDLEHFAYTNTGIKRIGAFNALSKSHQFEDILPDVFDLLKEQREPVYLDFLNGRFLFFSVINANYIYSKTSFVYNTIDAIPVGILAGGSSWPGITIEGETIAGSSFTAHIQSEIATAATAGTFYGWEGWPGSETYYGFTSGSYYGMYSQWNGNGISMYTAFTTPMNPYEQDSFSVHVDNNPIHSTHTFTFIGNAKTLSVEDCIPDNSSSIYALGWTYPGINNIGSAFLGLSDSYLAEFQATQLEEWGNFATIQTANKAVVDGVGPYSDPIVQGSTIYYSSALAQAQIDALVAAGGGSGNSHVVSNTKIGEFLSGAGTVTDAGTIANAGTYHATFTMEKVFLGGWDVMRKVTRTYSIRPGISEIVYKCKAYQGLVALNWNNGGGISFTPSSGYFGAACAGYGLTSAAAIADYLTLPNHTLPLTHTSTYTTHWVFNFSAPQMASIGTGVSYAFVAYLDGNYAGSGRALITSNYPETQTVELPYYIDYVDTYTIESVVNPTITLTSSASAAQETLNWGYNAPGSATTVNVGAAGGFGGTGGSGGSSNPDVLEFTVNYGAVTIAGTGIVGTSFLPLDVDIVYPGVNFLIDNGSPAPIYPTFSGSLVFDTGLKKWGKSKNSYRTILDMAPINAVDSSIDFTNFGVNMAQLDASGVVKVYDSRPTDSWIRYGKIGYYRQGMTQIQEVEAGFRNSSTGNLIVDTSMDGRALEPSSQSIYPFSSAANITGYFSSIGKWHTIMVSGQWDLQYLEFRGNSAGRR